MTTTNQRRTVTLEEFLQNKTWNPSILDGLNGKKMLHMRLEMKPGTTADQLKITLNGHDLRVAVQNKGSADNGRSMSMNISLIILNLFLIYLFLDEHSYRQITLFPTCEAEQIRTELRNDGFLHIEVPIKL